MVITTYRQASDFLARAQAELERNEVLNGLPLGITLHLYKFPERIKIRPYLATVEDEGKLLVAAVMTPQTWTSLTGEVAHLRTHERLFELTQVIAPRPGPGELRIATPDDTALVVRWIKAFQEEALHTSLSDEEALAWARRGIGNGEVYLWVLSDGAIVSLLATTRPVSRVISIASVYTPPELRGQGYASRSVAALSQHLLDSGWQRCSLFTDLSNPTSNSIYQRVGYRPVRDFNEYDFSH